MDPSTGSTRWSPGGGRCGSGSTSPTTTTSAPPSLATRPRSSKLLNAVHDNGRDDIYLGTYEGLYCVSCELYYAEDELLDGRLCPIHGRPVERMTEENYFFRLSAYEDRLLEHYEREPVGASSRRSGATRCSRLIRGGLQDFSISRTNFDWGDPAARGTRPRLLRLVRRPHELHHRRGLRDRRRAFARCWPANIHIDRQGHPSPHAIYWPAMLMAARHRAPGAGLGARVPHGGRARRCRRRTRTGIHPFELIDHFGVDSYRYYFLREIQFGQDGSFSWESMVERHNADLANDSGTSPAGCWR